MSHLSLPPVTVDLCTGLKVQCIFKPEAWLVELKDYPDQMAAQVMLNGMREGVNIRFGIDGNRGAPHSDRNLMLPRERKKERKRRRSLLKTN